MNKQLEERVRRELATRQYNFIGYTPCDFFRSHYNRVEGYFVSVFNADGQEETLFVVYGDFDPYDFFVEPIPRSFMEAKTKFL